MENTSTKSKIFSRELLSLSTLIVFTGAAAVALVFAARVPTNYAMDQFLPRKHDLLQQDRASKKLFHISQGTPHILLLSVRDGKKGRWHDGIHLAGLDRLTRDLETVKGVESVVSLGNIQAAYERGDELVVDRLPNLRKLGLPAQAILNDPLYTPNLISRDGRDTAVIVTPGLITRDEHEGIMKTIVFLARKQFPDAKIQLGGPAAIRNQLLSLLSREVLLFIFLALVCAVLVLKIMFRGYAVLGQVLYLLVVANTLAVGVMGLLKIPFNLLTTTMPVLVTVSSLGICTHLLMRMTDAARGTGEERAAHLKRLMKEISTTVLGTGLSTCVGFACLIPSDVPIISSYGLAVAAGVLLSTVAMLAMVPSLYLWVRWPEPRPFLNEPKRFAKFLTRNARWISPAMLVLTLAVAFSGANLSWTARLFDDLPERQSARRTTDLISRRLGGVANVDFVIGNDAKADVWKSPVNIRNLDEFAKTVRSRPDVGSVLSLADFLNTGRDSRRKPLTRQSIAEMQFLYSMSGSSPLRNFLSSNERWTRIQVRLPDLSANVNQNVIAQLRDDLKSRFPGLEVKTLGFGAIVPPMNDELSSRLMWGFFEALFWIVLMMAILFRSLRWALVGIIPNLVPPAVLLGFLAIFDVDIKPGIAIIFSITLGIAFDNTIYILGRLRAILAQDPRPRRTLPIYTLMKRETMPCLVSNLCLFAGFTVFMFSAFPVNKLFGAFVLVAILAGLLGDLVWLPALLRAFPRLLLPRTSDATIRKSDFNLREAVVKMSPYLLLLGLGLAAFHGSYAGSTPKLTVEEILKDVERRSAPPDERVTIKMVITDSDGSKKNRGLTILRKNAGEARALVRLTQPSDLKGLTLLTVATRGKEDQWLYLPSDKKSRRILGSNKRGKFLDSEIAYEDMRVSTYREFKNKIVKETPKSIQIDSVAKPGSESSYGRIVTWISNPDYRIQRVDYYDRSGKLLKKATFDHYARVGDKYWRARRVHVVNVQDKRETTLAVQSISVNKIDDDEVSLAALEE